MWLIVIAVFGVLVLGLVLGFALAEYYYRLGRR